MKLPHYVSFCLVLTVVWMQLYAKVRETFNGTSEYQAQIQHLKQELEHSEVQAMLQADHFLEFRQYVATLMPDVVKQKGQGEEGYPFRSLASTISIGKAEEIRKTLAKTLFEKGREHFRKREFTQANRAFKQLIDKFGFSPNIVESHFLMAEGYFQSEELEECTTIIQKMVELFPSHELTGFAMVRLGRIYEMQNRNEEAVDIYKTVLRSFPQRDVASQARASMRGMDL
jgi:TolA-binding protein